MKPPYTFLRSLDSTDVREVVTTVWPSPEKLKVGLNMLMVSPDVCSASVHLKYISSFQWRIRNADGSAIGSDSGS